MFQSLKKVQILNGQWGTAFPDVLVKLGNLGWTIRVEKDSVILVEIQIHDRLLIEAICKRYGPDIWLDGRVNPMRGHPDDVLSFPRLTGCLIEEGALEIQGLITLSDLRFFLESLYAMRPFDEVQGLNMSIYGDDIKLNKI